jgi:type IX secretion system PorP/SprF family membrane protein
MKQLYLFSFWLIFPSFLLAQDVHFTQYDHAIGLTRSAAMGGYMDNAYQRVNVAYRNQWQSVPVAYNSVLASWDREIGVKKMKTNHLGVGFSFLHDAAGDSKLGLTQVNLHAAYHFYLNKNSMLSAGLSGGYGLRQFSMKNLRFDTQYDGDAYDANLSNRENVANTNFGFLDIGTNVTWQYRKNRKAVWLGANAAHLNEPMQSFYTDGGERLPRRLTAYTGFQLPLGKKVDWTTTLQFSQQNVYQEIMGSILLDYHLNEKRFKQTNLLLGVAYRNNDAVAPMLGMRYNTWRVMLSYDINTSPFSVATRGVGGPEISLQHLWYKVIPNPKNKACPVY